ncbi:MAG TPA: universal stress protein [Methylomirabilota bacterium]|nr:universal stress protein [Methylomirabilota bacterium]
MYTRMLIPLDGSKTAEKVLPYARFLARALKIPVELLGVIDIADMATHIAAEKARYLDTMIEDGVRSSLEYLRGVATTFPAGNVKCAVEKGGAGEVIIEKGEADTAMLIAMATHGRSGVDRWLLGSVAEKVLRGTANALLLIRAPDEAKTEGEATLKSIVVPLDGSELAETVLPMVGGLAKKLDLEVVLFRAYNIPYSAYAGGDGYYAIDFNELIAAVREEAQDYLEKKVAEVKKLGVEKVSYITKEGLSADQIIRMGRETPDNFIAMCSHGRSGVKRWVLGSVTETVVRHSGDPVLVIRPA